MHDIYLPMPYQAFSSLLLNVICQADARVSVTDPSLTKAEVWNRLMRRCWPTEGTCTSADEQIVNELTVRTFFTEFTLSEPVLKEVLNRENKLSA